MNKKITTTKMNGPLGVFDTIRPSTGDIFKGMTTDFTVFEGDDKVQLYFVAQEIFEGALGMSGYRSKLSMVPEAEKMKRTLKKGSRPMVCISETAMALILETIRYSEEKHELVEFLNNNYSVQIKTPTRKIKRRKKSESVPKTPPMKSKRSMRTPPPAPIKKRKRRTNKEEEVKISDLYDRLSKSMKKESRTNKEFLECLKELNMANNVIKEQNRLLNDPDELRKIIRKLEK